MSSIAHGCFSPRGRRFAAARGAGALLLLAGAVGLPSVSARAQAGLTAQLTSDESGAITLTIGDEEAGLEVVPGSRGYRITPMPTQTDLRGAVVRVSRFNARVQGSVRTDPTGSWLVFDTRDGRLPRLPNGTGGLRPLRMHGRVQVGEDGRALVGLKGL